MNGSDARQYLLGLPEAWEDQPFGPEVIVFKIGPKMFAALGSQDGLARVNLKCDPDEAQFLRQMFDAVQAGYHMNKTHWNTVLLDGSIPSRELAARGVAFESPPTRQPWGGYMATFEDPDGNLFYLDQLREE